jgi:hypothetical protein
MAIAVEYFDAAALQPVKEAAPAPLLLLDGTNLDTLVRAYDDTIEEYVGNSFPVPANIDTGESVTFRTWVMAATAASANVAQRFAHYAMGDGETFDGTYTNENSGDKAIDSNQDDFSMITWTETVTNLGWAANDLVFFLHSRYAAGASNLSGDMYLKGIAIEIPLT